MHWAGAFIVADYIPYLKWVTKLQGINASFQRLNIEISSFIPRIIDERRNAQLSTNSSIHDMAKDFMDVLIATHGEDGTGKLSNAIIQDIIMVSEWTLLMPKIIFFKNYFSSNILKQQSKCFPF